MYTEHGSMEGKQMLEDIWEEHKGYLRRLLISLSRDVDLADDLLQETYLSAARGFADYRGGDARAWLAAIAKNAFYMHIRRRYVRSEVSLDDDIPLFRDDTEHRLLLLELRKAVSGLPADLKEALILKHYGGFTYQEIAERSGCAVGTIKWRVSTALGKLKTAFGVTGEEPVTMRCTKFTVYQLLDYVYGTLSHEDAAQIEKHLTRCPACRQEVDDLRKVVTVLDVAEGSLKSSDICVLDSTGGSTDYLTFLIPNDAKGPIETIDLSFTDDSSLAQVILQGQEVPVEVTGQTDNVIHYRLRYPNPVQPGEDFGVDLAVLRTPKRVEDLGGNKRRLPITGRFQGTMDWIYIQAVRLPEGAKLLNANPEPTTTKTNGAVTLTWRVVGSAVSLGEGERGMEMVVDTDLEDGKQVFELVVDYQD